MVVMVGMVAFAVDLGYMQLVRTQLQVAADASVMAATAALNVDEDHVRAVARQYAAFHVAAGKPIAAADTQVEFGTWDMGTRTFQPTSAMANAVRVTVRAQTVNLFFGRVFGRSTFDSEASAIAMAGPRDIAFVVDLSGSMNDDTEPAWATPSINEKFAPEGFGSVGNQLLEDVYTDFGFGAYPGTLEWIGQTLPGVSQTSAAYAEMTMNGGALSSLTIPAAYRIISGGAHNYGDSEAVRKQKAYSWIIDNQLARIMPNAKPVPSSASNYAYWAAYLDYIIESRPANQSGDEDDQPAGVGNPPYSRGTLPPSQSSDRIDRFNNPNTTTFPTANSSLPRGFRNRVGHLTYVQFMMDHGRDFKPGGTRLTSLAKNAPDCPFHNETVGDTTFSFPPRAQPEHAARRAIIAALQVVKERNRMLPNFDYRDWVSVISFDSLTSGGPLLVQSLTGDYDLAMNAVTTLQATGDMGPSTATEAGLDRARQHIKPRAQGGAGRNKAPKIVVLLTDGAPNLYISSPGDIDSYISDHASPDYYRDGSYWLDAPLMQAAKIKADKWFLHPVGLGLGTDYGFMDRLARLGGTANASGQSPRGSGNPAEYEQRLVDIFRQIILSPQVTLVK
jgi:hypothetical protein